VDIDFISTSIDAVNLNIISDTGTIPILFGRMILQSNGPLDNFAGVSDVESGRTPKMLLSNYPKFKTNYWRDNFSIVYEDPLIDYSEAIEIDAYFNDVTNYCSTAMVSFFTFLRNIDNFDSYIGPSRAMKYLSDGTVEFAMPVRGQGYFFENTNVVGTVYLDSGLFNTPQGIFHHNAAELIREGGLGGWSSGRWYNQRINDNPILTEYVLYNYNSLTRYDNLHSIPMTYPVKINLIPVAQGQRVNEFVYRSSLGGFCSLNIVGDPVEEVTNKTTRTVSTQATIDNTVYNNGDVDVIQLYGQYYTHAVNSFNIDSNDVDVKYKLEYRTQNKDQYQKLKDLVESESIYYRIYDKRNPETYKYVEVDCKFDYNYEGNDYTLGIEFKFMGDESGTNVRLDESSKI
jgi:hypothetical protein